MQWCFCCIESIAKCNMFVHTEVIQVDGRGYTVDYPDDFVAEGQYTLNIAEVNLNHGGTYNGVFLLRTNRPMTEAVLVAVSESTFVIILLKRAAQKTLQLPSCVYTVIKQLMLTGVFHNPSVQCVLNSRYCHSTLWR